MRRPWIAWGVALLVVAALVTWWVLDERRDGPAQSATGSTTPTAEPDGPGSSDEPDFSDRSGPAYATALDPGLSTPREDSYYPDQGDPGIDTLHYGLDLTWDPDQTRLTGVAAITLRATVEADEFELDLLDALEVSAVTVDGQDVDYAQAGDQLVVEQPVGAEDRLTVRVSYAGTPAPVPAPTTRSDFSTTGLTVTDDDEIWTMQEPFGAFTWYPVNDQPSDKALYDFTVRAPRGWVGVANGELTSRRFEGGHTVTQWHLSQPAASYLTTLAVGDFVQTEDSSPSGVPISYWTHRGARDDLDPLRVTPQVMAWTEKRLGPYPFDSLGILVVDSDSGMETQTMITLGDNSYTLSPPVLQHELTHQWYGDLVTPTDWRDVWMNEGMTMFIQGAYEADQKGISIDRKLAQWAPFERQLRAESGPPGAYDAEEFGEGNIYYGPALMWNELRHRLGDQAFWSMVRAWPAVHADGNATREEYFDWVEKETGLELTSFFDDWIMGTSTPES
ncbi:putative membrane alanine aminopeptidase [metagenome]|uniref:Putative membrane alanine aminopeptidase n=1 Tax=metagenome TaxID=256318 RepID=A0A2P2BYJ7_9ZZZZ